MCYNKQSSYPENLLEYNMNVLKCCLPFSGSKQTLTVGISENVVYKLNSERRIVPITALSTRNRRDID